MPTMPDYEMTAGGGIAYRPVRAHPSRGFGPAEVHPEMVPETGPDGAIRLVANGHWRVDFAPGSAPMRTWVFKDVMNGKPFNAKNAAEMMAAVHNGELPTRVVGYDGEESHSEHSKASVEAKLAAAAGAEVQQ